MEPPEGVEPSTYALRVRWVGQPQTVAYGRHHGGGEGRGQAERLADSRDAVLDVAEIAAPRGVEDLAVQQPGRGGAGPGPMALH